MVLNPDTVLTEVWKALNSNVTLQGADYLGGTGKIWKGQRRPGEAENPLLTVSASRTMDAATALETWSLVVTAHADDLDNRTADIPRLGRVTAEAVRAVEDATLSVTGGKIFNIYVAEDSGPRQASASGKEHQQEIRFRLHVIAT